MQCRDVERVADLSLDGEVSPQDQAELDSHLMRCPRCRDRTTAQRWMHDNVCAKLQSSSDGMDVPASLQTRISTELRTEGQRRHGFGWRAAVPVVLAAAVVGILSWSRSTAPSFSPDETVVRHTRNVLPEVRARGGDHDVQRFLQRRFGHSVELPQADEHGLRLVGVRMSNIDRREAAHLMYDHRGARVSVFANPRQGQVTMPESFERQQVKGRTVMVGRHRGYTVVAAERDGMIYHFVSDLDRPALLRFVSTLHR